jgi:hypothetical protein
VGARSALMLSGTNGPSRRNHPNPARPHPPLERHTRRAGDVAPPLPLPAQVHAPAPDRALHRRPGLPRSEAGDRNRRRPARRVSPRQAARRLHAIRRLGPSFAYGTATSAKTQSAWRKRSSPKPPSASAAPTPNPSLPGRGGCGADDTGSSEWGGISPVYAYPDRRGTDPTNEYVSKGATHQLGCWYLVLGGGSSGECVESRVEWMGHRYDRAVRLTRTRFRLSAANVPRVLELSPTTQSRHPPVLQAHGCAMLQGCAAAALVWPSMNCPALARGHGHTRVSL